MRLIGPFNYRKVRLFMRNYGDLVWTGVVLAILAIIAFTF